MKNILTVKEFLSRVYHRQAALPDGSKPDLTQVRQFYRALVRTILSSLLEGKVVRLYPLGEFYLKQDVEREGWDCIKKERIQIPSQLRIRFKASRYVKDVLKEVSLGTAKENSDIEFEIEE